MIAGLDLPEALARCVAPEAPEDLKLTVAAGAIPMAPAERLATLTALLSDPSERVRRAAREAWEALPAAFVEGAAADPRLPEPVLDRIAILSAHDHDLVCRVLAHPRVGRRTLARFAGSEDEEVLTRIAQNHRVLDRYPDLGRALLHNPHLHPADRGRLDSLYGASRDAGDGSPPGEADLAGLPSDLLDEEARPSGTDSHNLYQLVQSLSVAEKIKLATLGSKSARRLLIRDTNKTVATAVIKSPKIREDEVQAIAQDRTVAEEVLRLILQRKDWLKSYPIRLALCQNPKTPTPRALRLLETLQDRDLRQIARSRNVPSPVSAAATRILARRGKI
ncbi:MAG: hypothetical protein Kow0092_21020 [Deferrisomatales bacterium]